MNDREWTLTEIAKLLNEPQHRLIYLCEKGVVIPEYSQAQGRGSSRRFSARNIFEISIALVLSEFHFPASNTAYFLYAIRSFEASVRSSGLNDFTLPNSLTESQSPEIIAMITNGSVLYFSLGLPGKVKTVFGGVDIGKASGKDNLSNVVLKSQSEENKFENLADSTTGSNIARFEINLTKIAQNLELD